MARKSNKTAHVLNLITNAPAKNEIADADLISEPQGESDSVSVTPEITSKPKVTIPILEMATGEKDPVSNIIKNKLLEEAGELPDEYKADQRPGESGQTNNVDSGIDDEAGDIALPGSDLSSGFDGDGIDSEILNSDASSRDSSEKQMPLEAALNSDDSPDEVLDDQTMISVSDSDKTPGSDPEDTLPESSADDVSEVVNPETDYCYINVMETIVKELVVEYMNKFEMCTCNRCIVDTTALALTNLSPKYIVADKGSISPLLNYYSNKFSPYVIMELTKACLVVSEKPHH